MRCLGGKGVGVRRRGVLCVSVHMYSACSCALFGQAVDKYTAIMMAGRFRVADCGECARVVSAADVPQP